MKVLELSLVGACPLNCSFCAQDALKAAYIGPKLMSMETFMAGLANAGPLHQISFAGFAEPFLNPRCTEMVREAARVAPTCIYSTAVGMTPADVSILARLNLQWFTLHLPDAVGNMKFDVTPAYVRTVAALLESSIDVRPMAMGPVHPAIAPLLAARKAGGLESMQSRAGHVGGFVALSHKGSLKCRPAPELDHPVMLPDGRVVLCCQCYSLDHVLGNLSTTPWDEIYRGEAFRALQAAMASRDGSCLCRGCSYAQAG